MVRQRENSSTVMGDTTFGSQNQKEACKQMHSLLAPESIKTRISYWNARTVLKCHNIGSATKGRTISFLEGGGGYGQYY